MQCRPLFSNSIMSTKKTNAYLNCSPVVNLKLLNCAFDGSELPAFTGKHNKTSDILLFSVPYIVTTIKSSNVAIIKILIVPRSNQCSVIWKNNEYNQDNCNIFQLWRLQQVAKLRGIVKSVLEFQPLANPLMGLTNDRIEWHLQHRESLAHWPNLTRSYDPKMRGPGNEVGIPPAMQVSNWCKYCIFVKSNNYQRNFSYPHSLLH